MVVVRTAMSSLRRNARIQGLKGEEAAAHRPARTADTSSHGNSSRISPDSVQPFSTEMPWNQGKELYNQLHLAVGKNRCLDYSDFTA